MKAGNCLVGLGFYKNTQMKDPNTSNYLGVVSFVSLSGLFGKDGRLDNHHNFQSLSDINQKNPSLWAEASRGMWSMLKIKLTSH